MVMNAHEKTVSGVTSVYMEHTVQCTGVSSVLDDTSRDNNNICITVIQVYKIIVV